MDYGTFVGLQMNARRMAMRRVFYDGLAHALAQGAGEVPLDVVAAACDSREAAERLAFRINADRDRAARGW